MFNDNDKRFFRYFQVEAQLDQAPFALGVEIFLSFLEGSAFCRVFSSGSF